MNLSLRPGIESRMARLFDDAGLTFTWYRFVQVTGATASYGMGGTPQYATGYVTGIWADPSKQRFWQQPGGVTVAGQETLYLRAKVGTADVLAYSGQEFGVEGEPFPAQLFGVMYYRTPVKRA